MRRPSFSALLSFAFMFAAMPAQAVIYGHDDRINANDPDAPELWRNLSNSTGLMVSRTELRVGDTKDFFRLRPITLGERYDLCEKDPFGAQPAPGFCSGFLAAPDVFVTAGHCANSTSLCQQTAIIFDFQDGKDPAHVPTGNVFFCKEILRYASDPKSGIDFAVIRLDRSAPDRLPLTIPAAATLAVGDAVTAIGYPHGGPAKIIGGATVRSIESNLSYFVANIDGFEGNSGSPVFSESGLVEGIIVRGEKSYRTDRCLAPMLCENDGCRGEDILKSQVFLPYIPTDHP